MTSSFFSNPEDELTVEELKSLGKLIPKIPGPKQWDTKYAPGRGEGRAAFAKSKRNLDAMLERDALRAKNKGNVGIGGTPQTRDHSWFDGGNNYASQPGTGQFIRLPEDMQTTTAEDQGNLATAQAVQKDKIAKEKSIGATNARASLINAARGQAAGKGSVGRNYARIQEITTPVEQKADATKGAQFKSNITGKTYNIPELETSPWNSKTGSPITEIPKGGLEVSPAEIFNPNSPINKDLPTFGESVKMGEAMGGAGWAAGANMLGKAMQMLDPKKEKKETGPIATNTKKNVDLGWRLQEDPFAQLQNYWNA